MIFFNLFMFFSVAIGWRIFSLDKLAFRSDNMAQIALILDIDGGLEQREVSRIQGNIKFDHTVRSFKKRSARRHTAQFAEKLNFLNKSRTNVINDFKSQK